MARRLARTGVLVIGPSAAGCTCLHGSPYSRRLPRADPQATSGVHGSCTSSRTEGRHMNRSSLAWIVFCLATGCSSPLVTDLTPKQSTSGATGTAVCGEASCTPVVAAYVSHFTGPDCTGTESYYTPYLGYDGVRRSWDGNGLAGNTLRTQTNVSYKTQSAGCVNAWPGGNTLSDFVTIYRTGGS